MQQALLPNLLSSIRSIEAAKNAVAGLGLPLSESDLLAVAERLLDELNLLNTWPIDPDTRVHDTWRHQPFSLFLHVRLEHLHQATCPVGGGPSSPPTRRLSQGTSSRSTAKKTTHTPLERENLPEA